MPHSLPGNYSIGGGRGWDSRCLTSWVSFPPSPSPFRTSAQMLETARSSRHGCKLGGGVWLWNERIKWRDGGAGAPPSRHFIRNGPTKHGIYKQELLLFNAPTYRLFRSVNSLGQLRARLLLTFFLLIFVRWSLSFALFFPYTTL